MKNVSHLSLVAFLFIVIFALTASAQTPQSTPPPTDDGEIIKVSSRLIMVPVSVTDANGQPVLGLSAQDFRVSEEGKPQQVENVSDAEKVPLEIALLIDVSSSVNKIFELEKSAAAQFLQGVMRPEDRATIFLITDRPVLMQTRDTAANTAVKVRSISGMKSSTAFYDTVSAAAQYLSKNSPARSRRVILSLSDGEDNYSEATKQSTIDAAEDLDVNKITTKDLDKFSSKYAKRTNAAHTRARASVLKTLQNADTVFYSLNPSGPSVRLNVASQRAQDVLQQFADQTGGTAFLPQFVTERNSANFDQRNAQILERIFAQISAELRAQYLVQYYSEAEFPNNRYVKLDVGLQNPRNLKVRARQGYFAKN
ncbi:MAG TPA: VWA domain-containing protein [Pyrinomonadaceae bacterium]